MNAVKNMSRQSSRAPGTCLIVSDAARTLFGAQLQQILERRGFAVLHACDAEDALKTCWRNAPSIIFLPQNMRQEDSANLLRRIRKMPRSQSAIVMIYTETPDPRRICRMIWDGASDCIALPFNWEILEAKLRQAGYESHVA